MEHLEIACDLVVALSGLAGFVSMSLTIETRAEFE